MMSKGELNFRLSIKAGTEDGSLRLFNAFQQVDLSKNFYFR